MLVSDKLKKKIADKLRPFVDEVGKQLYLHLDVVINKMNIDCKDLFNSSHDYISFWNLVAFYYNDYIVKEEEENASN